MSSTSHRTFAGTAPIEEFVVTTAPLLEGKRVELYIDGKPVSVLKLASESYEAEGTERVYIAFETTSEAIKNPSESAAISAAMRGFAIGDSAGVRIDPKRSITGIFVIESLEFVNDVAYFKGRSLSYIYKWEGDTTEPLCDAGETVFIQPCYCERVKGT